MFSRAKIPTGIGITRRNERCASPAGEPLRRATLSQSLYPELSIRSFSKLDQTDHIGRWDGAESECVGPKLGVQESHEKNEENHNLRFNGTFRLLCVNISPGWTGSRRPLPVSRRWVRWRRFVRARRLLRLPDRDQRLAYALRGRWFRRQRHYRPATNGGGSFAFGGAGIGALSCTWRCPDGVTSPAPNPPGLWREYMVVMNSTNFCKDHMNPNGFTSDPVLATEGVPPDERPPEAPEIPGRPIPARQPPAPALQVTPGIPGALTPGIPNP